MNPTKTRMLSDIIKIKELARPQDVNEHIRQGWKLLDTYTASGIHEKQVIKYCIGWPKTAGRINIPKSINEQKEYSERKKFIYSL